MIELLTASEVGRQVKAEPRTVREWTRLDDNPLPYVRIGRFMRFVPAVVESWIEGHRQGAN